MGTKIEKAVRNQGGIVLSREDAAELLAAIDRAAWVADHFAGEEAQDRLGDEEEAEELAADAARLSTLAKVLRDRGASTAVACGHSVCSQNHVDTGERGCVREPCSEGCPGYDVFNVVGGGDGEVQRCDECDRFEDDDAARIAFMRALENGDADAWRRAARLLGEPAAADLRALADQIEADDDAAEEMACMTETLEGL